MRALKAFLAGGAAAALILAHGFGIAGEVEQYDRASPKTDDQFIVGVECNKRDGHLEIGFFDADHVPDKRMDLWDTFDLKRNAASGSAVEKVLSVARRCDLGGQHFQVRITGAPGNWNLNGRCGALTYAKAKVWRNGVLVFDEDISSCEDGRELKLIRFVQGADKPVRRRGETLSQLFD